MWTEECPLQIKRQRTWAFVHAPMLEADDILSVMQRTSFTNHLRPALPRTLAKLDYAQNITSPSTQLKFNLAKIPDKLFRLKNPLADRQVGPLPFPWRRRPTGPVLVLAPIDCTMFMSPVFLRHPIIITPCPHVQRGTLTQRCGAPALNRQKALLPRNVWCSGIQSLTHLGQGGAVTWGGIEPRLPTPLCHPLQVAGFDCITSAPLPLDFKMLKEVRPQRQTSLPAAHSPFLPFITMYRRGTMPRVA